MKTHKSLTHDIEQEKSAKNVLRKILAWQETIIEGSRDAIFISNSHSQVIMVNGAASELTGYTREELLDMKLTDLYKPVSHELTQDSFATREKNTFKGQVTAKDGTHIDAEFNTVHINIAETPYVHTVARDISERTLAEAEIKSLAKFPGENPNPVLRVTKEGQVLYANAGSRPLLKIWDCATGQCVAAEWRTLISDIFNSGQNKEMEVCLLPTLCVSIVKMTTAPMEPLLSSEVLEEA
ncbi:MAG: PAS domain-containing protein [bacterium]